MLDIKEIRQNTEAVKKSLSKRNKDFSPELDKVLSLDEERRGLIAQVETLKQKQNETTKIIPVKAKAGENVDALKAEMREIGEQVKGFDAKISALDAEIMDALLNIPNMPSDKVPAGADEHDNVEVRKVGEPRQFSFPVKAHWDIGDDLGTLDPLTAAKLAGSRFTVYKGAGARLERALVNFMLDTHTEKHGYLEIFPPFMANSKTMQGTGQLPKFKEDMFKVEGTDYYLIPTAEVPVTNMYQDDILDGKKLPLYHTAYTACFRAEAGAAGRDNRGLIRQHQFNKVELVKFSHPDHSYEELESLTNNAEEILKLLGLPYRVILLCGGDMGFSSAMTYDIEVWMPSYQRYVEISSCSNFETYQARRGNIKFKMDAKDKAGFVHTLNGSGLAVGRTSAAIMENFQNEDGSFNIPEVLQPYMNGMKKVCKA